ncbi:pentatricopeptide repeat-containing protein [Dorcoceras hygrometricum]|uniref:Pentatricopeptide repeat-containing protein n=1 Tax=Dorcoceras hygrometricum TaxID=472368 RepID=A0A2Z7B853_9LAMI|nr:pentatricopeptide repeat-containing protein [Dorcoceras hygrometricum]
MVTKNISRTSPHLFLPPRFRHLYSSSSSSAAADWYKSPTKHHQCPVEDPDPIITALSQAIQNLDSKSVQTSLKHILPSVQPQHIITLITLNPDSLTPHSLFSFFTWLSSHSNTTFRHTLHTYCTMIHFLCTHQLLSEAKSLLQMVVSRKGKNSASAVFGVIVETKGTQRSDLYVFTGLMTAYLETGFVSDAIQCFRLSKNHKFRVSFDACRKVLEHLMKLKSFKSVWGFYKEILECGYPASLYFFNNLMHRFCKEGEIVVARSIFCEIRKWGLRQSVVSFNTLINGYIKLGDLNEGFRLKASMETSGLQPDIYTYNALINGLCRDGQMDDANDLFSEMLNKGLVANFVTFTTLINGHCKNGRMDLAMEMYQRMLGESLTPDLITYNTILSGLCRKGDTKEAQDLVFEMSTKGLKPDKFTYTTLADGFCKEGDLDKAFQYRERMLKESIVLDNVAYATLIYGLCRQGKAFDAENMLREMMNVGLRPDDATYTMVINEFCKMGE